MRAPAAASAVFGVVLGLGSIGCEGLLDGPLGEIACAVAPGDGTLLGGECGATTCGACETCVNNPLAPEGPTCAEACISDEGCETACCTFAAGAFVTVCQPVEACQTSCGGTDCLSGEGCADDDNGEAYCSPKCGDDEACGGGCCVVSSSGDQTCHTGSACG